VRSIVFDLSRRIRWPAPDTGRLLRNRHADTWLGRESELEARMEEVGREYAAANEVTLTSLAKLPAKVAH